MFDPSCFESTTGFQEPISLDEQIAQTLKWGLEHPDSLGPKPDYVAEAAMVDRYQNWLMDELEKNGT